MYTNMTLLSREAFDTAMDEMLSIQDAVRFLEDELQTRSLKSKIEKFSKGRDEKTLKNLLVKGIMEDHPESKQESVERRVRGWFDSKSGHSLNKEVAIEVAFILGLNLEEADGFVAMVSGEKLHWRSADEIAYIFALKKGMKYTEAAALAAGMQGILADVRDSKEVMPDTFTSNVRPLLETLETVEELETFLREDSALLGHYHNYAYQAFMEMLYCLKTPVGSMEAEGIWGGKTEELTIRDILREYMFQDSVIHARDKAVETKKQVKKGELPKEEQFILSRIQKEITDAWPDETTLSKMRSRKADVTRKVLVLLFLATDSDLGDELDNEKIWASGYSEEDYLNEEDSSGSFCEDMTREELFLDRKDRLNLLLNLCGYAELDPRCPFDWMILYCMCAEDLLDVDDRMKQIFLEMFGYESENEDT
ncbi:MAG: hypothetical protein Q4D81_06960 [Eubacteriales bacterium]|nr:hypothetical protein [Eubacteriales bacterium]